MEIDITHPMGSNHAIIEGSRADQIESIKKMRPSELTDFRMYLGRQLHRLLLQTSKVHGNVIISDGLSPGLVCEALAANDGSSSYLSGAIVPYSPAAMENLPPLSQCDFSHAEFSKEMAENCFRFIEEKQLSGRLLIGSSGWIDGNNAGQGNTFIASRTEITTNHFNLDGSIISADEAERRVILRERAAIITLYDALLKIRSDSDSFEFEVEANHRESHDQLLSEALHLNNINLAAWKSLLPILATNNYLPIAVGESFTFGKVTSLLTSQPKASAVVSYFFGWYDPNFKLAYGVSRQNIVPDKIAEPPTVIEGAQGLIASAPGGARLALATSGWANYWVEGACDFFSVALSDSNERHSALRYEVTYSKASPISPGRRELTRVLGVTACLYLLSSFTNRLPNFNCGQLVNQLHAALSKYGNFEEHPK